MRPRSRPVPLALLLTLGCHPPQSDGTSLPPPTTAPPPEDASTSTGAVPGDSSSAGSTSEADDSSGPSPALDLAALPDLGAEPVGCGGKIDFLFVISRWAGMKYFQEELLAGLPAFIATIESRFEDFDYHIMVVDGDPYWGLAKYDEACPEQSVPNYPCDYTPTPCDTTWGAGTVYPAAYDASNQHCAIDPALRYMKKGDPDLAGTFECAARVGTSGEHWVGQALTAAMQPAINDPGGCNPGFLRDDALLMVTVISNTYDTPYDPFDSEGLPADWAQAVLDAKHGDPESVVVLNIGDDQYLPECHKKDGMCLMAKMFPYALVADREGDYGAAFSDAAGLIETACAGFTPPA